MWFKYSNDQYFLVVVFLATSTTTASSSCFRLCPHNVEISHHQIECPIAQNIMKKHIPGFRDVVVSVGGADADADILVDDHENRRLPSVLVLSATKFGFLKSNDAFPLLFRFVMSNWLYMFDDDAVSLVVRPEALPLWRLWIDEFGVERGDAILFLCVRENVTCRETQHKTIERKRMRKTGACHIFPKAPEQMFDQ